MSKEEIRNLIVIGFNLYQDNQRTIMTKNIIDQIIDNAVEKIIKEKESKE